jgi:hypothetical protein
MGCIKQMWERDRLAGESGVSANIDVGWKGLFAGKPAPTGDRVDYTGVEVACLNKPTLLLLGYVDG